MQEASQLFEYAGSPQQQQGSQRVSLPLEGLWAAESSLGSWVVHSAEITTGSSLYLGSSSVGWAPALWPAPPLPCRTQPAGSALYMPHSLLHSMQSVSQSCGLPSMNAAVVAPWWINANESLIWFTCQRSDFLTHRLLGSYLWPVMSFSN